MKSNRSVVKLPYGIESEVTIPEETLLAVCGEPATNPIVDVSAAVASALREPIEFPPLSDITIPEDRVAILLEDGVPFFQQLVLGLVSELIAVGVEPENMTILQSQLMASHSGASPTQMLPVEIRDRVQVIVHQPEDRESLGFIGTSKNGEPIYVNRQIADADVMIPVGMIKPESSCGYWGIHGSLISFADSATQKRFLKPKSLTMAAEIEKRKAEVKELAWALGTRMTIQVIPGSGEEIVSVVAGDAEYVEQHASRLCEQCWQFQVDQRASLVIATMTGGQQQQSWMEFARAIDSALRIVEDGGAIAICSQLKMRPGSALKKLIGADSPEEAAKKIAKEASEDTFAAVQITRALDRTRIYLLSEFDEDFVEDLGIAYVSEPDDIARLASRHDSCIVLANAQHAIVDLNIVDLNIVD